MTSPAARELADEALVQLGRLQHAWDWLTEARLPGADGPPVQRPTDLRAAVRAAEVWQLDRAAALAAAQHGRKTGTSPAPLRLGPAGVRATIVTDLVALADRAWHAAARDGALVLLTDQPRQHFEQCTWCVGSGVLIVPMGWRWEWPDEPIGCPRCRGRGSTPTGDQCPACHALGPCRCDRADLAVALAGDLLGELLDRGELDYEAAADVEHTLYLLAEQATTGAGAGPDRRRLPGAECPVCGARELVPEVSNVDRRRWAIYCQGPDCKCQGPGCPCGIGTERRKDRRHMWPARTWDGPNGLAKRLGSAMPGTWPDHGDTRRRLALARRDRAARRAAVADVVVATQAAAEVPHRPAATA